MPHSNVVAPTEQSYRVRRHRLGFYACIISMLNVSSLPLAAYISEHFPWQGYHTPSVAYANYTDFNVASLALNQQLYSNATLPVGTSFFVDKAKNTQVARAVRTVHAQPMSFDECYARSLLGLPGLVFYTTANMQHICATLNNATRVLIDTPSACFHSYLFTYVYGRSCLWLEPGDAISGRPDKEDGVVTIYFAKTELRPHGFVYGLFFCRIGTTLFVWYRLYVRYYRHCVDLEARLRRCGHRRKMPPGDWSYEIVLGDPTAIVLMDAWVASLYYLDIWINITNFGVATMQMQVSDNIWLVFQAVLYLSRTVWFAYWGLVLVSYVLKRSKKQHAFSEVDPTVLAIAVTIYGPLFVFMLEHIENCARMYQRLFYCLVPNALQSQESEAALVCVIYTLTTLSFPLAYGVIAGCVRRPQPIPEDCSSVRFNSVKSAALFRAAKTLHIAPKRPARGGTVYHAMDLNPRLKCCPTISLRGTDCFVLCYCNGELIERLRLSLLSCVDLKSAVIPHGNEPSKYVVNELRPTKSLVAKERGPVLPPHRSYELRTTLEPSVWCI